MSTPKHTPGPWEDGRHGVIYATRGADRIPIISVIEYIGPRHGWMRDADIPTFKANARLVAAAPDLLSACAAMLCTWGSDDEDAIIAARDQARAAIVKATEPTS